MAKKQTKKGEPQDRGLTKMLTVTVVLGVVFSAGLITGQRLLRAESRAPLVSLSHTSEATSAEVATDDDAPTALRTTFSFYEHLTQTAGQASEPAAAEPAAVEPAAAAAPQPVEQPPEQPAVAQVAAPAAEPVAAAAAQPAAEQGEEPEVAEKEVPAGALPARYTLQVSSHPDRSSAESELERLSKVGVEPHIVVVNVPGRGELWRVRVGKFHSMDEARDFQGELKTRRGVAGFVTPL